MKILVFISDECETCDLWKELFEKENFHFFYDDKNDIILNYVDAFSDENQDFCDIHEVDELPRVKILDSNEDVIFDEIGFFHPNKMWEILYPLEVIKKKIAKFNLSKRKQSR